MACVAPLLNLMFWEDEGRACQGWGGAFYSGAFQGLWLLERSSLGGAPRGGASVGVDLWGGGATYHCHVAQFAGQVLQAVLGQLESSHGAIQLLLDDVASLLLLLECLLHRVAVPLLTAGSREVQQLTGG